MHATMAEERAGYDAVKIVSVDRILDVTHLHQTTEDLKQQEGLFEAKADGCLDSAGTWNGGMVE